MQSGMSKYTASIALQKLEISNCLEAELLITLTPLEAEMGLLQILGQAGQIVRNS